MMRVRILAGLTALLAGCLSACAALRAADRPNVLLIAIDDLRNDVGALGAEHAKTPQLDAFAETARVFSRHYVQVPTCGASRCALLRGRYPTEPAQVGNNGIRRTSGDWGADSLPAVFRRNGYRTLALGKITHYPGGRTGKDWAEGPEELPGAWDRCWIPDGPWETGRAIMHGYANGRARQPGISPPWEAHAGPDESYPDAWVAKEAVETLADLAAAQQPWLFAVGFFKPHLPFAAPKRWHDLHAAGVPDLSAAAAARPDWLSGWHRSGEFRNNYGHPSGRDPESDPGYARLMRRSYAACVSYMDAQVGRVLRALQENGLEENTVVVVWSDHGFLLGEHGIWGKHCLYEHALRSPLMIRAPGLSQPGGQSAAIVESVDVFPTLADLCGLAAPDGLDGRSLRPQLIDPEEPSTKPAHGFWTNGRRTVRTDRWRLIVHPGGKVSEQVEASEGAVELFDYRSDPLETRNHAEENPQVVRALMDRLNRVPQPAMAAARSGRAGDRGESLTPTAVESAASADRPPNVILIMADDQGSVDVGCYGADDLHTPHTDALAARGVRFTQFYSAAPVCSPSRAGTLTGRWPVRAGVPTNCASQKGGAGALPPGETTIAEVFREGGYATAHIGKWHIGYTPETSPRAQGFDHSFGHMGGCIDNYSHFFYWRGPNVHDLWRNDVEVFHDGAFFPDLMVQEAGRFIEEHRNRPFFIYYALNTPHYPYQGDAKWLQRLGHLESPRNLYAAFVAAQDERLGRLFALLDERDLRERTIIAFQSDNGHSTEERAHFGGGSAGPYRGAKFSLFEGGIRLPAIISWPGTLPEGEVRDQLAHACDLLPTLAELAGVRPPGTSLDGRSLVGVLRDPAAPGPHEGRALHWQIGRGPGADWAVREGSWKLIGRTRDTGGSDGQRPRVEMFLANIEDDPGESKNRAEEHPELVARLRKLHEEHLEGTP